MSDDPLARFAPGHGSAFVADDRMALTSGDGESAIARALRSLVIDRRSLADVMTELSQLGFDRLDSFALVVVEADGDGRPITRLLHRGDVKVTVERSGTAPTVFHRPQVATWREEFVDAGRSVQAELGEAGTPRSFWCDGMAELPAASVAWFPRPVTAPRDAGLFAVAEPAHDVVAGFEPQPLPPPPVPSVDADLDGVGGGQPPIAPASAEADDIDFANLVHHTVFRSPEDAAVRAGDEVSDAPAGTEPPRAGGGPPPPTTRTPPTHPMPSDATRVWGESSGPGLIDAVPPVGAAPSTPAVAHTMSPTDLAIDSDHDGLTVARRPTGGGAQAGPPPALPNGPVVHAVRCPNGHLNPPTAPNCRVCATPIADRVARTEPRPHLGVFRLSTGQDAVIAGPLVIGRNPPSSIEIDGEHAAPVAIDDSEISRYHLAVHLADWHVSVEDQGSTNGTIVRLPGKADQTLRPFERVQIVVGAVVELGGNVTLRYEVP